jgi:hypothetical protein
MKRDRVLSHKLGSCCNLVPSRSQTYRLPVIDFFRMQLEPVKDNQTLRLLVKKILFINQLSFMFGRNHRDGGNEIRRCDITIRAFSFPCFSEEQIGESRTIIIR